MSISLMDINSIVDAENANPMSFEETEYLAALSAEEVVAINNRIAEIAENPDVFGVLWNARKAIYDAVRALKKEVNAKFVGFGADGNNLDLLLIRPQDVKRNGTALTTFTTDVTEVGVADFESDTDGAEIQLSDKEARVYCGWADPIDAPKAVGVKITKGRDKSYVIPTLFHLNKEYPVIQHKPIIMKPEDSYKIEVRYNVTGTDRLEPIAVKITQGKFIDL